MEFIRPIDYFAATPHDHGIGLRETNQQPGTEVSPKLVTPAGLGPMSDQAFRHHAQAEISLVALVLTTAIAVATVILNW